MTFTAVASHPQEVARHAALACGLTRRGLRPPARWRCALQVVVGRSAPVRAFAPSAKAKHGRNATLRLPSAMKTQWWVTPFPSQCVRLRLTQILRRTARSALGAPAPPRRAPVRQATRQQRCHAPALRPDVAPSLLRWRRFLSFFSPPSNVDAGRLKKERLSFMQGGVLWRPGGQRCRVGSVGRMSTVDGSLSKCASVPCLAVASMRSRKKTPASGIVRGQLPRLRSGGNSHCGGLHVILEGFPPTDVMISDVFIC
jgi:hypothetical protein